MAARADQDRDRIDRAIQVASWLGAAVMFAYGAALSFDVLHTIAQAAGLSPVLAWLWPLGFETFMAVAAVAVLAEQRSRPHKTPWYPWVLTALAAGSSIALNFGHPYIPLDPPPRLLVACVYGVPPICAPFAWHLFLLRLAHRRHQDTGQHDQDASQHPQDAGQDPRAPIGRPEQPAATMAATNARAASNGQDGEPSRTLVQVLLAGETQDRPVSWQDVAQQTGLIALPRLCAATRGTRPPGPRQRPPTHPRPGSQGAMTPPHPQPPELRPMPTPGPLSDQEAAHRRRAWLASRRRWNHDLILVVLRYAPEADVARALDQLPAGELQQLARLLTQTTDLRQVARGILVDLQEHLDGRSAAPTVSPPTSDGTTPTP